MSERGQQAEATTVRAPLTLDVIGISVGAVVATTAIVLAVTNRVAVFVVIAALGVVISLLGNQVRQLRAAVDGRMAIGPGRIHEEVERARRLGYSFAVARLPDIKDVDDVDIELRLTDAVVRHGASTYLILPHVSDTSTVLSRLDEGRPQLGPQLSHAITAFFPSDAVTADGLIEACKAPAPRRRSLRPAVRAVGLGETGS